MANAVVIDLSECHRTIATLAGMMTKEPGRKYVAAAPIGLPDRRWPSQVITRPPIWCSTDLRDGNQALIEPMRPRDQEAAVRDAGARSASRKSKSAFPSASQTDFDFVRMLIEQNLIPDDVTIMVLTQAREELIRRTIESLRGARRAIVHVYNATAPAVPAQWCSA